MKWNRTLLLTLALLAALLAGCAAEDAGTSADTPPAADNAPADSAAADDTPAGDTAESAPESQPDIAVVDEMEVTLYLPDDQAEFFTEVTETVSAEPQGIVDALIAHGALPEGVTVNDFRIADNGVETTDGETVSYTAGDTLHIDLDLSAAFGEALSSAGTSGETMILGSVVNTMLTAYNADTITITCDGAVLETGHNVYDEPLTFYDLTAA